MTDPQRDDKTPTSQGMPSTAHGITVHRYSSVQTCTISAYTSSDQDANAKNTAPKYTNKFPIPGFFKNACEIKLDGNVTVTSSNNIHASSNSSPSIPQLSLKTESDMSAAQNHKDKDTSTNQDQPFTPFGGDKYGNGAHECAILGGILEQGTNGAGQTFATYKNIEIRPMTDSEKLYFTRFDKQNRN